MKLVAPADIKGSHCVDSKRGEQCLQLRHVTDRAAFCGMCACHLYRIGHGGPVEKCEACVDALTELGDR